MTDSLFDDITVDRSDLEACAECPMQMRLKRESKKVAGMAAAIGEACHVAISQTVAHYIDTIDAGEILRAPDLVDRLELNLRNARSDVQPKAIEACRAAMWGIARTLAATDPDNIRRFDGGKDSRSGQLSWMARDGFCVTAELDLLRATESLEKLREDDWKSGWGFFTTEDVATSFQFTLHAVLVFENYPGVNVLDVVVWNLRTGFPLPAVQFYRRKLEQYQARIQSAVDVWIEHDTSPIESVPCWAATEKCRICDVAARCPAAERPSAPTPEGRLRQLIATRAKADAIEKELQGDVAREGKPVETADGDSYGKFGAAKPTLSWKVKPGKPSKEDGE